MDVNNEYGCLEIQRELLPLLKTFDEFCLKQKIDYSLVGGSLLGAIRHNGFIPWDDDVDVAMRRDVFDRALPLLKDSGLFCLKKDIWIDRVHLASQINNNEDVPTIDLFVFDNVPDNKYFRRLKILIVAFLQGMFKKSPDLKKGNILEKVASLVSSLIGHFFVLETKQKLYDKACRIGNKTQTKHINCFNVFYNLLKLRYNSDMFASFERHQFEDIEVNIISAFDHNLSTQYGDYMTPPEMKDRKPIHIHH